jgi:three-Cys-motif partner protein
VTARHFDYPRATLAESQFGSVVGDIAFGPRRFTAHVPEIIRFVKQKSRAELAIFVLDQCGYIDVPLPTIRNILESLDNADVMLTFATDFLIDHLTKHEQTQQILSKVGISLPPKSIRTVKEQSERRRTIQFAHHREIPNLYACG